MKVGFVVAIGMVLLGIASSQASEIDILDAVPGGVVSNGTPRVGKAARTDVDGNDLAVDELLKIAGSEDESLRVAAVEVLGEMATNRARAALGVVLYGNSMGSVRAAAATELGFYGDGETIFALALALETERDNDVRDVIAGNLERNLKVEPVTPGVAVAGAIPPSM